MTILVCVFFVLAFYYKVCQEDKESTSTYPCANTVSAFIVNSDGTTTIDYQQYIESGTGYKRYLACNPLANFIDRENQMKSINKPTNQQTC